jgi:hypothetical protein
MFEFPARGAPGPAYQFSVRSDDGSRLWFDEKLMMVSHPAFQTAFCQMADADSCVPIHAICSA